MAITKQKKSEIIKGLHEKMEKSKVSVFINFHGLSVKDVSDLRRQLKAQGVDYKVAKKTLINRVLDGFGIKGEKPSMAGEMALIMGHDDVLAPAKTLAAFLKAHKEAFKILGGIFEGGYVDAGAIKALSAIPPREVLLGQLANVINSPVQGMVGALGGVTRNFVRVLSQIKK